jgi:amino acid adenylation domain-containing protein
MTAASSPACPAGLFRAVVRDRPDAVAVTAGDGSLTFAQLDAASSALATWMTALGAGPELVVALCLGRTTALITAMVAVWKTGAGFLLVDSGYPADRVTLLLDAAADLVVVDDTTRDLCTGTGKPLAPIPALSTTDSVASGTSCCAGKNVAYVIYTSGSTGTPKGVVLEHGEVARHVTHKLGPLLGNGSAGRPLVVAGAAPVSFDVFVSQFLAMACLGNTLVLLDEAARLDPWTYHPATSGHPPFDVIDGAPAQIEALAQCGMFGWPHPPRYVLMGGEAPSHALWTALCESPHTTGYNLYGATECTIDSTVCTAEDPDTITIGRPYGGSTLYVLDERQRSLPPGVTGELCIGGAGVGRGYLGRPRLTAERFVPDPFGTEPGARLYRTGDLGRLRPDGTFEFLGRRDEQIKIRGHRIECGEVESVLQRHPSVTSAAVVGRPSRAGDRELVAFVTSAAPSDPGLPARVREFLLDTVPAHLVPDRVVVLSELPLGPTGKVDRARLAQSEFTAEPDRGRRPAARQVGVTTDRHPIVLVPPADSDTGLTGRLAQALAPTRTVLLPTGSALGAVSGDLVAHGSAIPAMLGMAAAITAAGGVANPIVVGAGVIPGARPTPMELGALGRELERLENAVGTTEDVSVAGHVLPALAGLGIEAGLLLAGDDADVVARLASVRAAVGALAAPPRGTGVVTLLLPDDVPSTEAAAITAAWRALGWQPRTRLVTGLSADPGCAGVVAAIHAAGTGAELVAGRL